MTALATFNLALRALQRNKLRSLLTMLGIVIGVGAVVAMVGIGNGAKAQVEAQIATLGQNVILIFPGSSFSGGVQSGSGGVGTLKLEDAKAIADEVQGVVAVSPGTRVTSQLGFGNQNWSTSVAGEAPEYFDIRQWEIVGGAGFTEQDVRAAAKVAVIGATVAKQLFGEEEPIGQIMRVRNVPFQVIGVLKPKGTSIMGSDQDDVVIVPYSTVMKRLSGITNLRMISVQCISEERTQAVVSGITDLMRQRHRLGQDRENDFMVRSQQEIAEMATATSKVLRLLLGAIASVSLVVGGIGIMNIMLVSVTERTREIGIRIALGAHGADILKQFLIEAVTLSSLGGLIGILLGLGTSTLLSRFAGWPTLTSINAILIAFLFSAAVGVFFGLYPAKKAAALDPIDALRYE
ncbi:MAG: FtsX-like permease family protein [Proteobacteria bacterium]|nr:FtsX-like permease family protein [Pseudomonadota bacterium]